MTDGPAEDAGSSVRSRTATVLVGAAVIACAVVIASAAYVAITYVQVRSLGSPPGATPAPADAIVVMGAAQYDGTPSPMLEQRLETALSLHRADVAPLIGVTGGKMPYDRFTEAAASRRWLTDRGVDASVVLMEDSGRSTWGSLENIAPVLRAAGVRSVVMVSTDWHVARATYALRELGFTVVPAPAGSGQSGSASRWVREAVGVGIGRIIGFGTLESLTD